ncbi:hypothetical protein ORI89_19000 [Sphingobacterium sp. UT-1RO-CII-1]|uniref:hypothetical protein n=1 Tax=Sphingobacterium sp. UT-1RO-CII-1 TaxID=2995225 RepID=UPI00227CE9A8|nr:hypothetical protein [Sphingobacterium sp. UT-1RO-CII-1]MCY4781742.1 hypothetical protein [Sphingobacterium sp. UT-1RO-CII-1]
MKKLILVLAICTLISSCGLFRKTTKSSDSRKAEHEVVNNVEETKQVETTKNSTENTNTNEKSNEQQTHNIDSDTQVTADEINVDKDGNISAKGNAKLDQKRKDKGTKDKASETNINTNKVIEEIGKTIEQIKGEYKEKSKEKDKSKESEVEPSGKGIMFGAIGVLIVVFGVLWYFGVKRKI